jgi:hypothetical protein
MTDFLRMCPGCKWTSGLIEGSVVFLQPYEARFVSATVARRVVKREGAWLTVEVPDVPDSVQRVHIADCAPRNVAAVTKGAAW